MEPYDSTPQPGSLLRQLVSESADERQAAASQLLFGLRDSIGALEPAERVSSVILEEWAALGADGHELVPRLIEVILHDPRMLTIEVATIALALQGEDGATEVVSFLDEDDFVLRHKAAVAVGFLGRSARWAVPKLLRVLRREPEPLVVANLLESLGQIGGRTALLALETMYAAERRSRRLDDNLFRALERAVAVARIGSLE